jgi:hypothetical protein
VMYRVKPCVHGVSGASMYGFGGSGIVGLPLLGIV